MTKTRSKKQALLFSALSLLLCVSMFIGTTFAWFTDEVTSGTNQIVAGTLDVELYNALQGNLTNDTKIKEGGLFEEITRWEPGMLAYENLTIANEGNLALKYALSINFTDKNTLNGQGLSKVLQVAFVPGGLADGLSRAQVLETVEKDYGFMPLASFAQNGALLPEEHAHINIDKTGIPVQYASYAIVIHWAPSDSDDDFNANNGQGTSDGKPLGINLGVKLFATQLAAESDSFGPEHDEEAEFLISAGDSFTYAGANIAGNFENYGDLNVSNSTITPEGDSAVYNKGSAELENNDINGMVENYGDMTISGGSIDMTGGNAIYNEGDAELVDVELNMTNSTGYITNSRNDGSVTIFENVDATSTGGGVNVWQGEAIFKSGTVTTNSSSTSARHVFYVADGGKLTIEDGTFTFSPTNRTRKGSYLCAHGANAVIIVNGGSFGLPSTRTAPVQEIDGGKVIISGGSFKFDPSQWVATGCVVVKEDDTTWKVEPMKQADANKALSDAIADGQTDVQLGAGTYTIPSAVADKDITIEGVGESTVIDFTKVNSVGDASITFKNLHIQGKNENVMNGFGIQSTTGDIVYENCTFDGAVTNEYYGTVTYRNCTFTGTGYITTYAVKSATFENCVFDKADSRAVLVYSHGNNPCKVTLKDCTFKAAAKGQTSSGAWTAAVEVDTTNISSLGTSVTITNCTADAMYSGIVRDKSAAGKANAVITVDGEAYKP